MTDYTPTTEKVRDAYVRGMRDTFIASTGEHREEFDRWTQAHDDEVRASVQSPTREQIAEAIAESQNGHYWVDEVQQWEAIEQWERDAYPDNYPGMAYEDRESYLKDADAVLALFPQPTPSAETCPDCGEHALNQKGNCVFCDYRVPDLEPVSIADMAPGTVELPSEVAQGFWSMKALRAAYTEYQSTHDLHELARAVGNILKATGDTHG